MNESLEEKVKAISKGRPIVKMLVKQYQVVSLIEQSNGDKYLLRYRHGNQEFTLTFN